MKKYTTYAMAAFFAMIAVSTAAPEKEMIIEKEKAAWQNFKDKKLDEFAALMHSEFRAVYMDGVYNLQKELDAMKKMEMKSFSFSEFNVVFPDEDTATVTYRVTLKAMADGKDASGSYNVGSVWKLKDGEWRALFHTDVKEDKPAKPAAK